MKPFDVAKPLDMPRECGHCGQLMEPEVGFYYGAMFLSYIASCFIFLPVVLLLVFYFRWSATSAIGLLVLTYVLLFFRILRVSRALWLHIVVNYDGSREITSKL